MSQLESYLCHNLPFFSQCNGEVWVFISYISILQETPLEKPWDTEESCLLNVKDAGKSTFTQEALLFPLY